MPEEKTCHLMHCVEEQLSVRLVHDPLVTGAERSRTCEATPIEHVLQQCFLKFICQTDLATTNCHALSLRVAHFICKEHHTQKIRAAETPHHQSSAKRCCHLDTTHNKNWQAMEHFVLLYSTPLHATKQCLPMSWHAPTLRAQLLLWLLWNYTFH